MIADVHRHAWWYPEHFNDAPRQHAWQVSEQLNQHFLITTHPSNL